MSLDYYTPKRDGYESEWYRDDSPFAIIKDLDERILKLEEDAVLRAKHPALQEAHEQYEVLKKLVQDD